MSCEIPLLLFAPVPSEGQKGALGRKPRLSAQFQRQQREHAALEDLISGGPESSLLQSSTEGTALCSLCHCPEEEHQELVAVIGVTVVVGIPTSSRNALWQLCPEAVLKDPHSAMALY